MDVIASCNLDILSGSAFASCTVTRLDPMWAPGLRGIHTVNAPGGLTVIDARMRRRKVRWGS